MGWTYPVDTPPAQPQGAPTQIDAIYADDNDLPALEVPTQPVQAYRAEAVRDVPELPEDAAVVQVVRGSWSQPQVREVQPSDDSPDESADADPAADEPPAEPPEA